MVIAHLLPDHRGRQFSFTSHPVLSWRADRTDDGWIQREAELELAREDGSRDLVAIHGRSSVGIAWPWEPLSSYDTAEVRVRVTGEDGSVSDWSDAVLYQTGPLGAEDWQALFIEANQDSGEDADRGVSRFRRDLIIREGLVRATLSYTAQGAAVAVIDDRRVDDEVLAPGWTQYDERLEFCTVEVTKHLTPGAHVLGATVGPGWFGESFGFNGHMVRTWRGRRSFSAQLRLEYADGAVETVVTDDQWLATTDGPTTSASIYGGECYDARLADSGMLPGGVLTGATPAEARPFELRSLVPADRPPVRVIETRTPVAVLPGADGPILDFGQNLTGRLRVTVFGSSGAKLVMRHAEVLEDGELCVRILRTADSTDSYVLAGDPGGEQWAPQFTYHGFRYAQITGLPPEQIRVTAEVMHSDVTRIGWLSTGDELINRLFEAMVWTFRGNLFSVPTDCTARDERLGWTGNYAFAVAAAATIFDVLGFTDSWMRDVSLAQSSNADAPPIVVPKITSDYPDAMAVQAGWGDVATVVPSVMYASYGAAEHLKQQYPGMKAWVDRIKGEAGENLWDAGHQLGDWLDPAAPPDRPEQSSTPTDFTANAYYVRSLELTAAAARVVGDVEDAEAYSAHASHVRELFQERYLLPDGRLSVSTQTAYAIAIAFGLVGDREETLGAELARLVREGGYRIGTGLMGTVVVSDALTQAGHREDAQLLLRNREQPGWLAQIDRGATTIWERWDSILPGGTINPGEMNSFNQYSLACVADWMFKDIGGIAPVEPGYRRLLIRPRAGVVDEARASLQTPYGVVDVQWKATQPERGPLSLLEGRVVLPANTTAIIDLPGVKPFEVGSGTHAFA